MVISIPTAQRMVLEAGELVKVRTSYELLKNNGNLGHHSDGTTKSQQQNIQPYIMSNEVSSQHISHCDCKAEQTS